MVCMATLDEIAYNHHWHGDGPITRETLEEHYPTILNDLYDGAVVEQILNVLEMWNDTLKDFKKILRSA